ncbi:MAG: glutathione S-transferase family protein [Hyphomicrobiales bacterium]|nr:glutathione S-transferase family protein [Hyphomicrobiales bacterium]
MPLELFAHPFSSYSQKVLIALHERGVDFAFRRVDEPEAGARLERLWPLRKFPVLVDGARTLIESSVIVEYLDLVRPGPRPLVPADPLAALEVRFMDRFLDNYVMTPVQAQVGDRLRPPDARDAFGMDAARAQLSLAYGWLDDRMKGRRWTAGDEFTLADCTAAPALFYADWVQPIPAEYARARKLREDLLARASVARTIDDARPYRHLFPGGAPDRD